VAGAYAYFHEFTYACVLLEALETSRPDSSKEK
jgi:hypothetical protein